MDVGRSLTAELDLDVLLERVLDAAREVCGARYAALDVLDDDRRTFTPVITAGENLAVRPAGGHPTIRNFLETPILIRGESWGNLSLAEKVGEEDFDEDDLEAIVVLAQWAAIAIDNARLFEISERRRIELERAFGGMEASRDIALALGGETRLDHVLELIAKRARTLVASEAMLIWLADADILRLVAYAGNATPPPNTEMPRDGSIAGAALRSGKPVRIDDIAAGGLIIEPAQFGLDGAGSALIVPLVFRGRGVGVLAAFDHIGAASSFSDDDERALRSFAASAATAVATARGVEAQRLRDAIDAAEVERGRWARDLHDQTLQGLGAMKLALSAALRSGLPDDSRAQITGTVIQLEREIAALRGIIADLRPPALDELGVEPALRTLAERVSSLHGVELHMDLRLGERRLGPEIETTAYRVAQEALTNVVKHSHASHVRLELRTTSLALELLVCDNGRGIGTPQSSRKSGYGIVGMRERAEIAGGELRIGPGKSGGTFVALSLPLGNSAGTQ